VAALNAKPSLKASASCWRGWLCGHRPPIDNGTVPGPIVQETVTALDSYAEASAQRTGIHVILRGMCPTDGSGRSWASRSKGEGASLP